MLQLGELRPREAGDYRCVARNGHPPAIVKTVRLHVMCEYLQGESKKSVISKVS